MPHQVLLPSPGRPGVLLRWTLALGFCLLLLGPAAAQEALPEHARSRIHCEVAIVGGGAAGLHSAYRLGPRLGSRVCLFEKLDRLGGRIYDIARTPGGPVFGTGALRIMEGQTVVFSLADELGISYEAAPWRDDLISARGEFAYSSDDINVLAYPHVPDGVTETDLYNQLRFGPLRRRAAQFPDFRSYVRQAVGEQGYHFLTDVFRFRADFEYPLDARGYLDYLDEEWDVCCTPFYPNGGMSEFIRRMEQRALRSGVRIYKSEPALEIRGLGRRRYVIQTPRYAVTADRLIIAVDAEGFKHVRGDVAEAIQSQPQFQDLLGVRVVTITQWWPHAFWLGARAPRDVRRAWTTEHCLNFIEIPIASYAANQLVTRSVYDDGIRCVTFWENTAKRSIAAVEAEIARGLAYLFPGVRIPRPLKTHVQVWPAAWYWLRGGTRFTNADIARWALDPLPGEDIVLVGESYNPQRSGWTDGAYKSSINALNARYGFSLPGATMTLAGPVAPPPRPLHAPVRRSRSQGGL
ncbi:MAG: FAD-dependent oxidoreductase [Myxococcales bacterium]|nr:FAD-dependent oxidoreductase [Myxococcota bacterium]MDW8282958.1 FAD-dependent oxidoreductase [Myxococcales bacterium]